MTLRFQPFLLFVTLLVFLNACSTTSTRPTGDSFPKKELPTGTDTRAGKLQDQLGRIQQHPSDRSLAEVIELSKYWSEYQPELALEIVRSLESVPSGQLTAMIEAQAYDPEFTEWLELALQVRTIMISGNSVTRAARNWAIYHYGHQISEERFYELVSDYSAYFSEPSQVAVLLPTEGGLAAAGNAIRDGILSAYLDRPGSSVIKFYSSGNNVESAIAAFLQAREDGATQIVGPLRVESTRALAGLVGMDLPVLLLNEPASDKPVVNEWAKAVHSLTLSQTEEAAAIARRALALGQKQAIVIVPDSTWGRRIESAFTAAFEEGDGQISATAHFNPALGDHSVMLTQLLRIDESKQRKTDLQNRLGVNLAFEPIRRDDFDFVFMAADPSEGRELKPLLRFHDAGDIPVYAMSRIFSGKVERGPDQDLNGIVFPATAWQLRADEDTGITLNSLRGGAFGNLHALGRDAWNLLPWLPLLQKDPDLWFPAEIGALRMQSNGRLFRSPTWAQFSAGRPVAYQWPGSL